MEKKIVSQVYEGLNRVNLDVFGDTDARLKVVEKIDDLKLEVVETHNYPAIAQSTIAVKISGDTPLERLKFQLRLEKIEKEV